MTTRFDYVQYNDTTANIQLGLKGRFIDLAEDIEALPDGRAKSTALTKLEEAYMWVGKALRDQQIKTDPNTQPNEMRATNNGQVV